jgi:predicted Zn-dependent protease
LKVAISKFLLNLTASSYSWFCEELHAVRRPSHSRELYGLLFLLGLAGAGYYYTAPVVEVPISGRKRRQLIPDDISEWIGTEAALSIIQEYEDSILPDNHPYARMVASVGTMITRANNLPPHIYVVIESDEVNAFVTGSNVVFVFTGILPILNNVSGMAMVLGHEMGHVIAGHGADGIAQSLLTLGVSLAVQLFGTGSDIVAEAWELVFARPKQRSAELEADQIGYALMSRAGYDRREAPNVYRRMMISTGEVDQMEGDDWSDTHPIWPTRIGNLEKYVSEDPTPIQWVRLPALPAPSKRELEDDNANAELDNDMEAEGDQQTLWAFIKKGTAHPSIKAITPNFFAQRAKLKARLRRAQRASSL